MFKISMVVFDLSGTTVSDDNAVAKSLYEAALEFDLKVDLEDFEKTIGTNKIHLYQFMIAKSQGESVLIEHLEKYHFPEHLDQAMKIFNRYSVIMVNHYRQQVQAMPGPKRFFNGATIRASRWSPTPAFIAMSIRPLWKGCNGGNGAW